MKKNVFLLAFIMLQSVSALNAAENFNKNDETKGSIFGELTERALSVAMENIKEGSIVAINKLKYPSGWSSDSKNEYKDYVMDFLIKEGYKMVAKNYLEKLYEEQKSQQSGIYNEKTTVKTNNFSAIGYYIDLTLSRDNNTFMVRAQIINVSTGEIDGIGICKWDLEVGYSCN